MLGMIIKKIWRLTMKSAIITFTIAILTFLPFLPASSTAFAQELLDSYIARIGPNDHFNSRGVRLKSAAAIIRQDRANFHKFGKADAEDEYDSYFGSKANRANMERMLRNGSSSRSAINAIVNHQPLIRVKIYRNTVIVTVL